MPSLTNFLKDKTSTFKYKCNKIVKQHYLELWTKQAHSLKEGKLPDPKCTCSRFGFPGEYPGTFLFLFVICELIFLIWTAFFSAQNF
jgi:hypothetical protein